MVVGLCKNKTETIEHIYTHRPTKSVINVYYTSKSVTVNLEELTLFIDEYPVN